MKKTLLDIAQAATGELQLTVPSAVLSSADLTVTQIKALTVAACDELADMFDWQFLLSTGTITTESGTPRYPLPADYLRLLSNTEWNRTTMWPMGGDLSPRDYQTLTSGLAFAGPFARFHIVGNQMEIIPIPGNAQTLAFNYITRNYVIDGNTGLLKSQFTLDADSTVFHDRCLINFVKLKLLQVKGFDTSSAAQDFNGSLQAAMSGDVPVGDLRMAPSRSSGLLSARNGSQIVGGP